MDVSKKYGRRTVLRNFDFDVHAGEIAWFRGNSGSGKSTAIRLGSFLSNPTTGRVLFNGKSPSNKQTSILRRSEIGVIFQNSNLFEHLSVAENLRVASNGGLTTSAIRRLLEPFGLEKLLNERAVHLSGGEMQRVGICRALVNRPSLVLADEPTSGLDSTQREAVYSMLDDLRRQGVAVVVASHDESMGSVADRETFVRCENE